MLLPTRSFSLSPSRFDFSDTMGWDRWGMDLAGSHALSHTDSHTPSPKPDGMDIKVEQSAVTYLKASVRQHLGSPVKISSFFV